MNKTENAIHYISRQQIGLALLHLITKNLLITEGLIKTKNEKLDNTTLQTNFRLRK